MAALVLAVVAVVLNTLYVEKIKSSVNEDVFTVYQFIRDKKANDRISDRDFTRVQVPERFRASLVRDLGVIDQTELPDFVNDRLRIPGVEGSLLLKAHFVAPESIGPQRQTRAGWRDIAIPLARNSTPPSLRPGARVDLYADIRMGGELPVPHLVMENVTVLSVGDEALNVPETADGRFSYNYRKMSIEVTEEEALALSNVERIAEGGFRVAVRAETDHTREHIPEGGIHPTILDIIQRKQREPAPDPRRRTLN